jgi:hypothetical protein
MPARTIRSFITTVIAGPKQTGPPDRHSPTVGCAIEFGPPRSFDRVSVSCCPWLPVPSRTDVTCSPIST